MLNSADITSTHGDVRIDAAKGDINLEAAQVAFMDGSQHTDVSRRWYGKKKVKTTTITHNKSNAVTTDITANNIKLTSDGNINIYGSELTANKAGSINISAGKELNLYAVDDIDESTVDVKKKSSWLGIRYNKDHNNDTRQELSQLPTTLIGGKAYTKSGGNTLLQGTVFETLKPSDIQVGVGRYADDSAKLILTPITHQITTTHNQQKETTLWQKAVDSGSIETTAQLPKFNQTPIITSANGVVVQVPVAVTLDENNNAKDRINRGQEDLGKIALQLSKQPGYEYLAELEKRGDINWQQVELIQKNWDYKQEGLTPAAAALIALAVTVALSGMDGGGVATSLLHQTTANATTAGIAGNAAISTLATQATITLINNKGDINATLRQLASSATVRNMATSALTAGLVAKFNIGNNVNDAFAKKLSNGISRGITEAAVNATVNGVSFEDALTNSLRASLVDVFAGEAYSEGVKGIDADDFARNLAHKLAAAGVGCIAASAKNQSCDAGAIGAAVGEMVGDYLIKPSQEIVLDDGSVVAVLTEDEISTIHNIAKLSAGSIALLSHVDVDTAANSAQTAVENNAVWAAIPAIIWVADKAWTAYQVYQDIQALQNGTKTWAQLAREKGTEYMAQAILGNVAKFGLKAVKSGSGYVLRKVDISCFVAGTLIETIDGLKPIESIQQGDLVWSRHEETLEYGYRPVTGTASFDDKEIYEVVVQDSTGKTETFETTEEHPFWVVSAGWLPAQMLQAGMTLVNRDNEQTLKVVSQTKLDKTDTVYNFEVDEFHTYHIGEFGVWVHNSCFEEALNARFSNPNNVHHFIHGSKTSNHHWNLLVPDFNENEIKKIALEVLEKGRSVPYKPGVDSKVLNMTRNGVTKTVQVTYVKNPQTGEISISNGWVIK